MRLSEIQMEGFRGYPACYSLDLSKDVVVIFGDNGSGKSSLFNGMEWLLEDSVYLGESQSAKTGDRFRNIFTECERPWVQITFNKMQDGKKQRLRVTRRLKADTIQSSEINAEDEYLEPKTYPGRLISRKTLDERDIPYSWPINYQKGEFEQVFLNRKRLGKFIDVPRSERGGQFFKLLGYKIMDEYHDSINDLLAVAREFIREYHLKSDFQSNHTLLENEIPNLRKYGIKKYIPIESIVSFIETISGETEASVTEEAPIFLDGLTDLFLDHVQLFVKENDLSSENRKAIQAQLQRQRKLFEKHNTLSEYFDGEYWVNKEDYRIISDEEASKIKEHLSVTEESFKKVSSYIEDPTKFELLEKLDFLEYGLKLTNPEEVTTCPLCLQDINRFIEDGQERVKEHFTKKHKDFINEYRDFDPLDSLMDTLQDILKSLKKIDCQGKIKTIKDDLYTRCELFQGRASNLDIPVESPDFESIFAVEMGFDSLNKLIESIESALEYLQNPGGVEPITINKLSNHIKKIKSLVCELIGVTDSLLESIDQLNALYIQAKDAFEDRDIKELRISIAEQEEELEKYNLLDEIEGFKSRLNAFIESVNKLSAVNEIVRDFLLARNILKKTEEDLIVNAISQISGQVNAIYERINPEESLNQIVFKPSEGRKVDLLVEDKNQDFSEIEPTPQAFLSEGHLNCLGISIHLALQEVLDSPFDFVIFDDPIYSIDAGHRRKALDEIFNFAIRTNKQLIIATHDPLFFHYIKEKLRSRHQDFENQKIYNVINYSSNEPDIIEEGSTESFFDAAKQKIKGGCDTFELETAYVFMRREIEYICKEILDGKRVAKFGENYERLTDLLNLLSEIDEISQEDINMLQEARDICNPAAHYQPKGRESYTVARQVLEDIGSFREKYLK
jgi:DNA repair exonuclease SbcCD ATPase subunit